MKVVILSNYLNKTIDNISLKTKTEHHRLVYFQICFDHCIRNLLNKCIKLEKTIVTWTTCEILTLRARTENSKFRVLQNSRNVIQFTEGFSLKYVGLN